MSASKIEKETSLNSRENSSPMKKLKIIEDSIFEQNKNDSFFESNENLSSDKSPSIQNENLKEITQLEKENEKEEERKFSTDLEEITDNKLHDFLNCDLIKALDIVPTIPNALESTNSITTLCSDSPNFSLNSSNIRTQEKDLSFNLENKPKFEHNTISYFPIKNPLNTDIQKTQSETDLTEANNNKNCIKKNEISIKEYFSNINPLDIPVFIPKKFQDKKEDKNDKKINKGKKSKNKESANFLKNKYDDDVESIIIICNYLNEEKTKMPLEIRKGDWICSYCNNLNFSFRFKCNRCGLLRKSTNKLIKFNNMMNEENYNNYDEYNDYYKQ